MAFVLARVTPWRSADPILKDIPTRLVLERAGLTIDDIGLLGSAGLGTVPLAWAKALGADLTAST
jgi:hypothetical protein